jgi:tetratricopeptide (TPR) repeat protein
VAQFNDDLEAGREALSRFAWSDAFALLRPLADSGALSPEDLEGLAEAAWWHAELDACVAARERAYRKYLEVDETRRAGMVAINLAKDNFGIGRSTVGNAWLNRAENLLKEEEGSVELGHLHRTLAAIEYEGAGNFPKAIEHAEVAYEIGKRARDKDLMALALQDKGRALIAQGSVAEGMELMDEALVAAVSGELLPLSTGVIYCNMVAICEDLADMARAAEWTDAAKRWCERMAIAGFPGMCRVHRATIIRRRGAWREAEEEATKAANELKNFNQAYTGEAIYSLGEVRFGLGDLAGAEEAFRHAHMLGRDPQPGLSLLQLGTGRTAAARAGIQRAIDEEHRELRRARLLPAAVEVYIAAGDLDAARAAADELATIAATFGTPSLHAEEKTARGRVELAGGDAHAVGAVLRAALKTWRALDAPYEVAKVHLLLARAYAAEHDEEAARLERESAREILVKLGAALDLATLDDPDQDSSSAPALTNAGTCSFVREGEYWSITYDDEIFKLKDSKGLHYIKRLLEYPGTELHVLDLVAGGTGPMARKQRIEAKAAGDSAGAILDAGAKLAYRRRLRELGEDLEEAELWDDTGRAAAAREEIEFLTRELAAAVGLGGRDREAGSLSERARVNVTRTIRAALDRIREHSPNLGAHFEKTIKTGTFCSYQPDPRAATRWHL